jgi:hypothetical protein
MTVTDIRPDLTATPEPTTESVRVAKLRLMLEDPAQSAHHDDIRRAIDYLIRDTFVSDLAA